MDMSFPPIADVALGDKDREAIRSLARSLTPDQALWVSGYLAGAAEARSELLALAGEEASAAASAAISNARAGDVRTSVIRILYASETGNAAALARDIEAKAKAAGFDAVAEDLARYKTRALKDEQTLLLIASTHGEGDPPGSATGFFEFLASRKAPSLQGAKFAVLALGDSTYEYFCEAGKILDRRLEELGATRLLDRRDCDVDYEDDAQQWLEQVFAGLQNTPSASAPASRAIGPAVSARLQPGAGATGSPKVAHGKGNPFAAEVTASIRITGRGSSKDTRHLELSLEGSVLSHEPGDAIGILPRNQPKVVSELLGALGWSGSEPVKVRDAQMPAEQALRDAFEITALTPRFIGQWAAFAGDVRLAALAQQDRGEIVRFMGANQIVDVVRSSPAKGLAPQAFVETLRSLQPRLYSLASSAEYAPDEAHLCVSPVRFALNGSDRGGVASLFLTGTLEPGDSVPVYIQRNDNFRLPKDPQAPIVMVGAGTGVAPYRSFMQHREALGIAGRSWLFFGERNFRTDFLYQAEWLDWHRSGALTRVDVAFSRDDKSKIYVQHRLQEQAAELYRWIADGAHVYVCGDAEHMARDVHEALLGIVAGQGGRGREAAEQYLRELQAQGRYQRDVY
jgi:sulfite reductase (NADPH) flavoprotein alpha-component